MSNLRYVTISGETYLTNTVADCETAQVAMAAAGIDTLPVWEVPYETIEEAEKAGWDGARKTGSTLLSSD